MDDTGVPLDPTPVVGAPTDVAPRSHGTSKPAHERTAVEEAGNVDWDRIANSLRFRQLIKAKRRFIIPAMIFFIVYYFALPVLVGYAPRLMERRVIGAVNIAYLFALSQFFMAWMIAWLYVRAAARFDRMAADVLEHEHSRPVIPSESRGTSGKNYPRRSEHDGVPRLRSG